MMERLLKWITDNPLPGLLGILLGSVVFSFGLNELQIDTSIQRLIDQTSEEARFYRETVSSFGSDQIITVFIEDGNLFSPEKLLELGKVRANLGRLAGVTRVVSLWDTPLLSRDEGGNRLDAGLLIPRIPLTQDEALRIRDRALQQPELIRTLISADSSSTAIYLYFLPEFIEARDPLQVYLQIEKVLKGYRNSFETLFQLGAPSQTFSQYTTLMQDARLILPLSIGLIFGLLVLLMGSWHAAFLPGITSALSILWTLGFMGFVGIPGTNVNFILPSLLIVVGSTEDIHIFASYREGRRRQPSSRAALHFMASRTGPALLLTAVTTFVGFLSLSLNPLLIISEFGAAAAFGLLTNPLITIFLAPSYLDRFGSTPGPGSGRNPQPLLNAFTRRLVRFSSTNHSWKLVTAVAIFLGTAWIGLGVRFENDPEKFFRAGTPLIDQVAELRDQLSGPDELLLRLDGNNGALEAVENWRRMDEFHRHVEQLEWTGRTLSILETIKWVHRQVLGGKAEEYRIPPTIRGIREYLVLLESLRLTDYLRLDRDELVLRVRHSISSSSVLLHAVGTLEQEAKKFLGSDLNLRITGESLLIHEAVQAVVRSQWWSLLAASGVIFLILALWLRRWSLSLAVLIANLFPLSVNFCIMRLLNIPLDLATSMIGVVAIGVSVDHSIHLVARYRTERAHETEPKDHLFAVLLAECLPIVTSSLALASGFALLGLSRFLPVAHLGILGASVMVAALAANLFIIPLWLSAFDGHLEEPLV